MLNLKGSNLHLLTSDRPVEQVRGLESSEAFITLPIGPTRLFVAANKPETILRIRSLHPRDIVRVRNRLTVELAREFVWATGREQARFIRENFGKNTHEIPTLGERLAADFAPTRS